MERLTAEDRLMLWPDRRWPQEIGAVAVLDGSGLLGSDGRLRIETVRRAIESRLPLVPRFRQVLYVPRRGLGGPLWTDAREFDISRHVTVAEVPPPGDRAALATALAQLIGRRLVRSEPLWEMCFLTGLPEGRLGLLMRMHHAVADGIAGVATLGAFLDSAPSSVPSSTPPWAPAPPPRTRALLAENIRRRAATVGAACAAFARPMGATRVIRDAAADVCALFGAPPVPRTSLDVTVGLGRRVAIIPGDLEIAKRVAHANGATVNDVLLALTAAGLRGLLAGRGELTVDLALPVYVPVTLRPAEHRDQARGNMIGQSVVALPVGEPDAHRRLERIAAETARMKSGAHFDLGTMFNTRLARGALVTFLKNHPVSVTTADVPGPRQSVYLAGARLREVFPLLPLIGNVTIGVGALSYAGQFNITVVTDRDAVPDVDVFVTAAETELDALTAAAAAPTTPPR